MLSIIGRSPCFVIQVVTTLLGSDYSIRLSQSLINSQNKSVFK